MVTWTKHSKVLDIADVSWAKYALWAPAPVFRDGKYYLYFAANDIQNDSEHGGIGVAVARPEGPYKDAIGGPLISRFHNGAQPIDQDVFIDDDGQAYMYYGGWGHAERRQAQPGHDQPRHLPRRIDLQGDHPGELRRGRPAPSAQPPSRRDHQPGLPTAPVRCVVGTAWRLSPPRSAIECGTLPAPRCERWSAIPRSSMRETPISCSRRSDTNPVPAHRR
ncbi:hypothetical protein SBADM41S_00250 [Streptomyces badius]